MMPRIGSRKLYVLAQHELGSLVGFPERDRFMGLNLRKDNNLLNVPLSLVDWLPKFVQLALSDNTRH